MSIFCTNCGAENENESLFCTSCGSKLTAVSASEPVKTEEFFSEEPVFEEPAPEAVPVQPVYTAPAPAPAPAAPKKKISVSAVISKIFAAIGIIVGIAMIVTGNDWCDTYYSYSPQGIRFGADFYTEMYNITEDVYGRTSSIANALTEIAGNFFILLGLADISFFGWLLTKK